MLPTQKLFLRDATSPVWPFILRKASKHKGQSWFTEISLYVFYIYAYIFVVKYILFNPLFLKNAKASWKYFCPLDTWRVFWGRSIDEGKARKWSIDLLSLVHGGVQNQRFRSSSVRCKVLYLFTFYLTFSFTQSNKNWPVRNT